MLGDTLRTSDTPEPPGPPEDISGCVNLKNASNGQTSVERYRTFILLMTGLIC